MTTTEKRMVIALTLSTLFIIFNMIAVISGSAATYYSKIEQIIFNVLPAINVS